MNYKMELVRAFDIAADRLEAAFKDEGRDIKLSAFFQLEVDGLLADPLRIDAIVASRDEHLPDSPKAGN